jgi:autotransporter-associated beta strand protein
VLWSTDSTGGSAATTFASGDTAVFSAGTDATSAWTINAPSAITAAGITVEEGTVSMAGGTAKVTVGTGTITVNSGAKFSLGSSSALGASSGSTVSLNGSTIENRNTGSADSFVPVSMTITISGSGGILSYTAAGVLNIVQTGTPGNIIQGSGGITKEGAGVLAIATACTYSGPTTINNGTLRMRTSSNRLPTGTDVTINSPGVFDPAVSQTVKTVNGNGAITYSGSGTLTINGGSGFNSTITGIISLPAPLQLHRAGNCAAPSVTWS